MEYAIDDDGQGPVLDDEELLAIRRLKNGSIHDETMEFLLAQKGRLPRIASDIGVSPNTLYDLVSGRRASCKVITAEKVLRYKMLMGETLMSCQLRPLKPARKPIE